MHLVNPRVPGGQRFLRKMECVLIHVPRHRSMEGLKLDVWQIAFCDTGGAADPADSGCIKEKGINDEYKNSGFDRNF